MSTTRLLKGVLCNSQWFSNYNAPNYATLKLKTSFRLSKISVPKQYFIATLDLFLTMLGTELAHVPKTSLLPMSRTTTFIKSAIPCKHSKLLFNFGQTSNM